MNKHQADILINELRELNKTLKVIASSQERKYESTDVQDMRKESFSERVNDAMEAFVDWNDDHLWFPVIVWPIIVGVVWGLLDAIFN